MNTAYIARGIFLLLTVGIITSDAVTLTFEIPDNEKMCFFERFRSNSKYVMEYKVVRGGHHDIDAWIDMDGKRLYHRQKKPMDTIKFESHKGREYKFCFGNEFSSITHKVVFFSLRFDSPDSLAVEAGNRKPSARTLLEESMESIHKANTKVMEHQTLYRLREAGGKEAADDLNARVMWRSIGQSVIIMFSGFSQVFILKTLFTDRAPERFGRSGALKL